MALVPCPLQRIPLSAGCPCLKSAAARVLLCALAVCLLWPALPGRADSQIILFENYVRGMPRERVLELPGAFDCAEQLGSEAVCRNGARYLDHGWDMDFAFDQQGLRSVSLRTPFVRSVYVRAFAALDERFELVALQSSEPTLDLVALWRNAPHAGYASKQMTEYETRAMQRRELVYVFLERSGVHQALKKAADVRDLLGMARPDTRQAALALLHDADDREWIVLQYDLAREVNQGK
ncbi:hypothetical protein SAMN02745704_01891 [Paucidesulfovibrio gracilis DSM 16080]|uniref:Uncharacterized protein n=1 Tax=Paucidesulfovibrio gracilis DSM 16080 TaxID=1121449 RepID=A0A1T4X7G1_9BACT|nr:hypothetical protein [Paucidesulfovibrio gracilis]SKA85564.1 hypothetical protein SAMN02745704_01891 [Paucidesulfovibrio gracilis DSM 16080]